MATNSGVYRLLNISTGKFYIGSSVNFKKRVLTHFRLLADNRHKNPRLQNAFNKYGREAFIFEIIEEVTDREKIISREQHFLDTLKPCDENIGFNILPLAGAKPNRKPKEHQTKHTDEFKRRMSEERRGQNNPFFGKVHTPENLASMSKKNSGPGNAFFGKTHSDEFRKMSSLIHRGKTLSMEHRKKLSEAGKGRKKLSEHIKKIVESRLRTLGKI